MSDNTFDPLARAIDANKPLSELMAPREKALPPPPPPPPESPAQIEARQKATEAAAVARAAQEKLSGDALLTNPGEIRKIFPQLYKDVSVNHNDHIDMYEIQQGLKNPNLSPQEIGALTIMQQGYQNFCYQPTLKAVATQKFSLDPNGISAESMAMLDKAINRGMEEDPYSDGESGTLAWLGFIGGGFASGAYAGAGGGSLKVVLLSGLLGALYGAEAGQEAIDDLKNNGTEDKMYDQIKTGYLSFEKTFESAQTAKQ